MFEIFKKQPLVVVMLVMAVIGLIGSFALSLETVHHLRDPEMALSCSLSAVVNCATVMDSWQAEIFGFPNIFLGLMGFAVLVTILVLVLAGVKLPKWIIASTQTAVVLAFIFLGWLMYSSVFVIQVLCPWCVLVALSTIILLGASTRWSLRENAFNLSKKTNKQVQQILDKSYDKLAFASLFAVISLFLLARYVFNLV